YRACSSFSNGAAVPDAEDARAILLPGRRAGFGISGPSARSPGLGGFPAGRDRLRRCASRCVIPAPAAARLGWRHDAGRDPDLGAVLGVWQPSEDGIRTSFLGAPRSGVTEPS